jgi:phage replication initiation protein
VFDAVTAAACSVADSPHVVTTGGNSFPPPHTTQSNHLAHVDWLGFTINISDMDLDETSAKELMLWFLLEFHSFSDFFHYDDRRKGWFGYKNSYDIDHGSGILAFGGSAQKQTLHVELTGKGCAAIKDWHALRFWLEQKQAKITRVDLAHDDHLGQTVNLDKCKKWLEDGLFSCGKREPDRRLIDDLGTGKGSTLYVGKRANGKCFRGYEKGKQLGDKTSKWFRAEVEWKAKDRHIPFDVLINPTPYLAGSFPAMAFLSILQNKIKTIKAAIKVTVEQAVTNAKQTCGKLVNVLIERFNWTSDEVIASIRREGIPNRLTLFERHISAEVLA